ncbi:MAG TPA: Uma2 family endonuclease [Chloroflexota bacterium]|nr:Uma2 family endonuclease [Chloroflexota bacterium]
MGQALRRFTSRDLELMPDDGKRREIIDGELYVSKQPRFEHQFVNGLIWQALHRWSVATNSGYAVVAPGLVFAEDDDVVPDVAWIGRDRLDAALDDAGHFRVAPDLIAEVLSPGRSNEERDREAKLKLYSRRGVREYWIVDWRTRQVEVYRRQGIGLEPVGMPGQGDSLESPLLPGFTVPVRELFAGL